MVWYSSVGMWSPVSRAGVLVAWSLGVRWEQGRVWTRGSWVESTLRTELVALLLQDQTSPYAVDRREPACPNPLSLSMSSLPLLLPLPHGRPRL